MILKMFSYMLLVMEEIQTHEADQAYMENLLEHLKKSNGKVASFIGRYYAMDRDKRWERIKEAYDLIVSGKGAPTDNITECYAGILFSRCHR